MADFKAPLITAHEGTTGAATQPQQDKRVRSVILPWAKTAAQTDGDVIYLLPVKSSDVITGIYFQGPALTGASDVDFGLYTAASTPVVVDADLLMDGKDISAGSVQWLQIDGLSAGSVGKPLWSLAGASETEDKTYYLALTLNTGGTATGNVVFRVDLAI